MQVSLVRSWVLGFGLGLIACPQVVCPDGSNGTRSANQPAVSRLKNWQQAGSPQLREHG
jgi:hypothetical protein